jgi:hypothetical protein
VLIALIILISILAGCLVYFEQQPQRPSGRSRPSRPSLRSRPVSALSYPTVFDGIPEAARGPLLAAREAYVASDAPDAIIDFELRVAEILNSKPHRRCYLGHTITTTNPTGPLRPCGCPDCEKIVTMGGGRHRVCTGACSVQPAIRREWDWYCSGGGGFVPRGAWHRCVTDRTLDRIARVV